MPRAFLITNRRYNSTAVSSSQANGHQFQPHFHDIVPSYIKDDTTEFRPEKGVCTADGALSPTHRESSSPTIPLQKPDSPKSTATLRRSIPSPAYNTPFELGLHPVTCSPVINLREVFSDLNEQENKPFINKHSAAFGLLQFQKVVIERKDNQKENADYLNDKFCKPIDLCKSKNTLEPENTDSHICPECGKRYSTSSNLARHRQTHRSITDKKARKCPHCDKVYVSMPAFSMHVRTHNQGCQCPHCGKCFSRPWLLQGHIRTHTGEKPFKCNTCNKAFADKSNLRAHIQTHSNTKPYVCGRCGKAFALKSYLYKHEESSCMRMNRQGHDQLPQSNRMKMHKCD